MESKLKNQHLSNAEQQNQQKTKLDRLEKEKINNGGTKKQKKDMKKEIFFQRRENLSLGKKM